MRRACDASNMPDEGIRFEPTVYWMGDIPLAHGERDVEYGADDWCACLCGRPNFLMCPYYLSGEGDVATMTVGDPYGGLLDRES